MHPVERRAQCHEVAFGKNGTIDAINFIADIEAPSKVAFSKAKGLDISE